MDTKILLNSKKSKNYINNNNSINIELLSKYSSLPEESLVEDIDLYDVYNNERDNCNNFRLFFTIKPYCTNVLYNPITEIVKDEGSDRCINLEDGNTKLGSLRYVNEPGNTTEKITRKQAIRDTEYSNPNFGNLKYHCGIDIFNNHYLRSKGFFKIGNINDLTDRNIRKDFNTLSDTLRDDDGNVIPLIRETPKNGVTKVIERPSHLFDGNNTYSFFDAIKYNLREDNGWVGFYNKPYVNIRNYNCRGYKDTVNKCIQYYPSCSFVDLYPDRTLFSFLPKINKFRNNREEYNWKWCITYPWKKYDCSENVDFFSEKYGLKIIWDLCDYDYATRDKDRFLYFRTKCKNNLKPGDTVKISYKYSSWEDFEIEDFSAMVYGVGDKMGNNKEYYFYLSYDDVSEEIFFDKNTSGENGFKMPEVMYLQRVVDGVPCQYYMREFKKLKMPDNSDINSTLNKVAFSETIYGDRISQIIFTDDLILKYFTEDGNKIELHDNIGRPVTEVFLTIVKNNKGYKEWYSKNPNYSSSNIEYSHCFGKITSGFNFEMSEKETFLTKENNKSLYDSIKNYNVRCIHNVSQTLLNCPRMFSDSIDGITIDSDTFIGDLVEYDSYNIKETVLEDIMHRFNTAQREYSESSDVKYSKVYYDEIEFDDNDFVPNSASGEFHEADKSNIPDFTIKENTTTSGVIRGNIFPEGYFYKPHYRIKLKEFSDNVKEGRDYVVRYAKNEESFKIDDFNNDITVITPNPVYASLSDSIIVWYKGKYEEVPIKNVSGDGTAITFSKPSSIEINGISNIYPTIFIKNYKIPSYAQYINDGNGIYRWREIKKDSQINPDSDIFDRMFTNGAMYQTTDINFYLRRQDPFSIYRLSDSYSKNEHLNELNINGIPKPNIDSDYKAPIQDFKVCEK